MSYKISAVQIEIGILPNKQVEDLKDGKVFMCQYSQQMAKDTLYLTWRRDINTDICTDILIILHLISRAFRWWSSQCLKEKISKTLIQED